ncbi:MAG TPA: biotin-dependent carboxyltransferase family protein, partial [Gemmatimonadaceae bacterium]|nr:biotin-dependent carboxyltransferase family protein [Gemmatimonadaceae bacterium]
MTIRVLTGGLQTTVQDLGRPAHQHQGIPGGGAMDRTAMRIANLLVGNDASAAALETTLIGPSLVFAQETLIALTGADLEAAVGDKPIPLWHAALLPAGTTLRFGRALRGCRTYIAVAGGVDVPGIFGSRSTYLRAEFGGFAGRALHAGDALVVGRPSALSQRIAASLRAGSAGHTATARWSAGVSIRTPISDDAVVRLIRGAHTDLLTEASRAVLVGSRFRVSASSDRMGYRLDGETLALRAPTELLSEGVAFGTVQLPPGGSPIVLMADRQTTGGYPRIGEVATVDLGLIAQLKPGDHLRFSFISLEEAQKLYLAWEHDFRQAELAIPFHISRSAS